MHIPKTAGTSIEHALGRRGGFVKWNQKMDLYEQHMTYSELLEYYPFLNTYRNIFKFTFVRNPWDRLVSEWEWKRRTQNLYTKNDFYLFNTFESFVKNLDTIPDEFPPHIDYLQHIRPQVDFISLDGRIVVDFIGKFENLSEDFLKLREIIKFAEPLEHHRKSDRKKNYTSYYNEETIEIVKKRYEKDIECFGYKYGE